MTQEFPTNTEAIPTDACWQLLARHKVAQLAVVDHGEPDIFPISYVVDHGGIVFRTGAGTKLAALRHHPVALQVDGEDAEDGTLWSVVLKGRASLLEGVQAILKDAFSRLEPAQSGPKPWFVRIDATSVTGRRIHVTMPTR
jgi:nitroimidazol reductase NimA-like FMN-containing flavoprotein (pyridoxamine 5'-phosphate oxidase superfamily)